MNQIFNYKENIIDATNLNKNVVLKINPKYKPMLVYRGYLANTNKNRITIKIHINNFINIDVFINRSFLNTSFI